MLRVILLSCFASVATAETPLSIEKFRAIVEGNAYFHAFDQGPPFGVQAYHTGGGLTWWDQNTDCVPGHYEAGPNNQICTFEDAGDFTFCWTFYATNTGLRAIGQDGGIFIMTQTDIQFPCLGQTSS